MDSLIRNSEAITSEEPQENENQFEQVVQFRKYTDRQTLSIKDKDDNIVASISGYAFECGFDFKYMKNQEDIDDISKAIADVITQIMVDAAINAANNSSK